MITTALIAALAGLLSILSPCVLPLVPIVLGAAAAEHRLAPASLALGVALSFTALGLFVSTIGFSIGLDADVFRRAASLLMLAAGIVLLVPSAQYALAAVAAPFSNALDQSFGTALTGSGIAGQFALGLLLGAVWAPCVGPTLGAAAILAARGENLGEVATTMAAFGIGAALPLLAAGMVSREALLRWRGKLMGAGQGGKTLLGGALVILALLILTGLDKSLESALVAASPTWLIELTTRF